MYCRNCGEPISPNAYVCTKCGVANGAGYHYCPNCGKRTDPQAVICVSCGIMLAQPVPQGEQKSKLVAGLLALFLGGLGIHNFYLGNTNRGLLQLLVSIFGGIITCGLASTAICIWAFVESIMIFTGYINCDANGVPLKS